MKDLVVTPVNLSTARAQIAAGLEEHKDLIRDFHRAFYESPWTNQFTSWMGIPILKNPLDLHIYQEILWDVQPTLLIETGTAYGASALYFATMMDRRGIGRVVTIDIEPHDPLPRHPRLTALTGSSTDPTILATVRAMIRPTDRVMVVLDSDHSARHVWDELECYAPMVTKGQFLVVEDTNINGHPVRMDWMGGPGPMEAVKPWLESHPEFEPDVLAERMMLTFYPNGWLRRIA